MPYSWEKAPAFPILCSPPLQALAREEKSCAAAGDSRADEGPWG